MTKPREDATDRVESSRSSWFGFVVLADLFRAVDLVRTIDRYIGWQRPEPVPGPDSDLPL